MPSRRLRFAGCCAALLLLGALPSPPWRSVRPGTIVTVAGGRTLPAHLAPEELAFRASALAADPDDGTLYLADAIRNAIFRVEPGGTTVSPWSGFVADADTADGRPAPETAFARISAIALDRRTRELFVADALEQRVRAVPLDGAAVRTVAGPDDPAGLAAPSGLAADPFGMLFVSDAVRHRIVMLNRGTSPVLVFGIEVPPGGFRTVAGTGAPGSAGDRGPAAAAQLDRPADLALDASNNLYLLDGAGTRIRKVDRLTGFIRTLVPSTGEVVTGLGVTSRQELAYARGSDVHVVDAGGDDRTLYEGGDLALAGVATGPSEEVFVADVGGQRVIEIADGRVRTLVGGAALPQRVALKDAEFGAPDGVSVDRFGNVFVVDGGSHAIRRILLAERVVETFMGTGVPGTGGDGGPPQLAALEQPTSVLVDGDWSYYVTDGAAGVVRRVGLTNDGLRVATVAGAGCGGPRQAARHPLTGAIAVSCERDHVVRLIDDTGRVSVLAGSGRRGFAGDGGPAHDARLDRPSGLAFDREGNLYVADTGNQRIRRVDPHGRIATFAGTGARGYEGDGGPAARARFDHPSGLALDAGGNVYVADTENHCVRRIAPAAPHVVETIAGTGRAGYAGDGGPARAARLAAPAALAVSGDGFLYIADRAGRRVRAVKLPAS